jgi:hypothetical protein
MLEIDIWSPCPRQGRMLDKAAPVVAEAAARMLDNPEAQLEGHAREP